MNSGTSGESTFDKNELATGFASIESGREYHRVIGTETISAEELPVFIKLGVTALVIINPGIDLSETEREGTNIHLNTGITSLLIDPLQFDVDQRTGYKSLPRGKQVLLGRNHQDTYLHRFKPLHSSVSGNHASITTSDDGEYITIADLHSANGTYLARRRQEMIDGSAEKIVVQSARGESWASEAHPDRNEDAYAIDAVNNVYAVFDGLSSDTDSTIAAQTAAQTIADIAQEAAHAFSNKDAATSYMHSCLYQINDRIRAATDARTTGVVAKLHYIEDTPVLSIAHSGDSRAYLLRGDALIGLTIDHSVFRPVDDAEARAEQEKLANATEKKQLSGEEIIKQTGRNAVTAYLGGDAIVRQDIHHYTVQPGDTLLLTSDGIHDNLTHDEIRAILLNPTISEYPAALNSAALERSRNLQHYRHKRDDMTTIVVKI